LSQLHLTDSIPIDPIVDSVPVSYDRQYSSSSQGIPPAPPSAPSPVQQPFQGAPIPPQLSPFNTPAHHPHLGSSPTNHAVAELAIEALSQEDQKSEKIGKFLSIHHLNAT